MCGRFDFHGEAIDIAAAFGISVKQLALTPKYNIAPTDAAPVLWAPASDETACAPMRFGWPRRGGGVLVNARADSVLDKAFYRQAVRARRCAVVAQGFYEWEKVGKRKQPYYVQRTDGALMAFAALWQAAEVPEQGQSFVIITTHANGLIAPLHERMPVVLERPRVSAWLHADGRDNSLLDALMQPSADGVLRMHAVSTHVNKADNDGPMCIVQV